MPIGINQLSLPLAPEPSGNGSGPPPPPRRPWRAYWLVAKRWPARLWTWLNRRTPAPSASLHEEFLQLNLARLQTDLHDREQQIFRLKTEIELAKSEILVRNRQIQLMAEVHELDRARVAADMAAFNAAQADCELRRERGRG